MATETSRAWKALESQLNIRARIAADGYALVTAKDIKTVGRREPRLMTKWDTRESRPAELDGITILPVANGKYLLVDGDGYHDIEAAPTLSTWRVPPQAAHLETLPWGEPPSSESQVIDMAFASGLLADFLDETMVHLTIRGRLRTPAFNFIFECSSGRELDVSVDGVQTEVDAGFEGNGGVHLVEAKLGRRTNTHCRQLYYPYRMWQLRLASKPVHAVYLSWANQCFSLRRYCFDPAERYHGIVLVKARDYVFGSVHGVPDLAEILSRTSPSEMPQGVPFPQADDIDKVIDIVDVTASGIGGPSDVAERYGFVGRQAHYYSAAASFLGFLGGGRRPFALTQLGHQFKRSGRDERIVLVAQQIARMPVFRDGVEHYLATGSLPDRSTVADWIRRETSLSGTTPRRRASTVASWLSWLVSTVDVGRADD